VAKRWGVAKMVPPGRLNGKVGRMENTGGGGEGEKPGFKKPHARQQEKVEFGSRKRRVRGGLFTDCVRLEKKIGERGTCLKTVLQDQVEWDRQGGGATGRENIEFSWFCQGVFQGEKKNVKTKGEGKISPYTAGKRDCTLCVKSVPPQLTE